MEKITRWLLVILTAFLLAACESEDEVESLDEPPDMFLLSGEERIEPFDGASCWPDQEGGVVETGEFGDLTEICQDDAIPDFTEAQFIDLSGEAIRLELEEPLPDRLDLVLTYPESILSAEIDNETSIDDSTVSWDPELAAGDYILVAMGFWQEVGGATYYFPVTLD